GELQLAFERLKRKLAAEGLFDEDRKRPLPKIPERIGVVTSQTGAALQDIRSVLERRMPSLEVILVPVKVQGAGAAEEIVDAIELLNRYGEVDVIIAARGGGSLEDLWAFNEEIVARAIYHSKIPIMSAVGHEIDFSIADFVADLRAPTPSAAAELVVPHRRAILDVLRNSCYTLSDNIRNRIASTKESIRSMLASYSFNRPLDLLREHSQRLDETSRLLNVQLAHSLDRSRKAVHSIISRLNALAPQEILKRGYAVIKKNGKFVSSAQLLAEGDVADIVFHDGNVRTKVQ
ncbi:MAG: exodeoxyribonuclease VII large subunit, partial [Ignavibacteriales bacterium]|nr:exodeoxyribonuclease VII large subunit [Ignavibacteriales bacterium]